MGGRLKLGQILVSKGLLQPEQLASALGEQQQWGGRLGITLLRMGFLDEPTLVRTLAAQLHLPVADIGGKEIEADVLDIVPLELAEKYRCLPLFLKQEGGADVLLLAMDDPSDLEALDDLSFRINRKIQPVLVTPTELEEGLHRHYHGTIPADRATPMDFAVEPPAESEEPSLELPSLEEAAAAFDPGAATTRDGEVVATESDPGTPAPAVILRALSQLLVEKGVITRAELVERLRRVGSEDA